MEYKFDEVGDVLKIGLTGRLVAACSEEVRDQVAQLQPHPRIVFDITKVYRVFEIFDTVEQGLASFAK